jgi:hypothetical membrane protein
VRILSLGGVAGPVLFTVVVIICGALRPDYSHATQFISELGARGTSRAALMNFAGFVPTGMLLASFGVSLAFLLPRRPVSVLAAACMTFFGVGLTFAGIYSCDPGCPHHNASWEATLHERVSAVTFLFGIGGSALLAYHFRGLTIWNVLWPYSAITSAVALGFLIASAASVESRSFTGLWQRLFIGTLYLWCMVVSLRVFRCSTAERHPNYTARSPM